MRRIFRYLPLSLLMLSIPFAHAQSGFDVNVGLEAPSTSHLGWSIRPLFSPVPPLAGYANCAATPRR